MSNSAYNKDMQQLSKDHSANYTDEAINTMTHMIGAIFALFGALLLLAKSFEAGAWWQFSSFIPYGIALVSLFTMSALHHGINGSEKVNRRLRTLDYVAVYGLILGTTVPVCLVSYRGAVGYTTLTVATLVTALGITLRSIYHTLPGYVSLSLYLSLGWLPALMILIGGRTMPLSAIGWLVAGGLCYTVGSVIYGAEKPTIVPGKFGFHEIWHIAVLLGALCHYVFMYRYILG